MYQYFEGSLKEGTREDCGSGIELIVTFDDCSEIPPNFISRFLSNALNKTSLNKYLANRFIAYHEGKQSIYALHLMSPLLATVKQFCQKGIESFLVVYGP